MNLVLHRPGTSWLFLISNKPARELGRQGRHPAGLCGYSVLLFLHTQLLELPIYPQAQTGLPMGLSPQDTVWRAGPLVEGRPGRQLPLPSLPHWLFLPVIMLGPHQGFQVPQGLCGVAPFSWSASRLPGSSFHTHFCCVLFVPPAPPLNFSCGPAKGNATGSCFSVVARGYSSLLFPRSPAACLRSCQGLWALRDVDFCTGSRWSVDMLTLSLPATPQTGAWGGGKKGPLLLHQASKSISTILSTLIMEKTAFLSQGEKRHSFICPAV